MRKVKILILGAHVLLIIVLGTNIEICTLIADLLLTCMLLTTTIYFPLAMLFLMEVSELLLLEEQEEVLQAFQMSIQVRIITHS